MLTDEEKKKIKEDEDYRASVRNEQLEIKKRKEQKEANTGCLIIFILFAGFALYVYNAPKETEEEKVVREAVELYEKTKNDKKQCEDGNVDAAMMAKRLITNKLKSPSSAKFPKDPTVYKYESCKYRVVGEVDASNAFGVIIRTKYTAEVLYVGDDKWRLISHKLVE